MSKKELRPFQREDVDFIKANKLRTLIASAPGVGKTAIALTAIEETEWALPALVICPASVTRNWAKEAKMWAKSIKPLVLIDDMNTPIPQHLGPKALYIISWALLDARYPELAQLGLRTLVADEFHYVKSEDAIRTMALQQLVPKVRGFLGLTGTPIINKTEDLNVLKSFFGVENPPMIRRLLEDVAPDVPPKTRSYLHITLRDEDKAEYARASEDFETWLLAEREKLLREGKDAMDVDRTLAAEALAKVGYLRRLVGEAKTYAAVEWITRAVRIGEPVVVFCEHQDVLHKVTKGLKKARIQFEVIEGATPPKERHQIVDDFQNFRFPVLVGTTAAKEGITLTRARHLLFVERYLTAANEEQAEDRVRRLGQHFPTTIWFLHAVGTIDDRLDTIIRTKRHIVREAIGSRDVAESPTGNVENLVQLWSQHVEPKNVKIQPLGHGDPLPPLPRLRQVYAIVFSGPRWETESAVVWCRMNGYGPTKKETVSDSKFRLIVNRPDLFKPNKFAIKTICADIKIICGQRLNHGDERRVLFAAERA